MFVCASSTASSSSKASLLLFSCTALAVLGINNAKIEESLGLTNRHDDDSSVFVGEIE